MIITKISGGLGNQMFQYATGRAVALREKTVLKLDLTNYENDRHGRHYLLDNFNIMATLATKKEINQLRPLNNILTNYSPRFYRFVSNLKKSYVNEAFMSGKIPQNIDNLYLDGYWQNEIYFKDYFKQIQNEFKLKSVFSKPAANILKMIKSTNSVAIHIRRGDYVSVARIRKTVGVCESKYYHRAVEFIEKNVARPTFFVFSESDGIKWAKTKLNIKHSCVMVNGKDYEDITLMSHCLHNIIANSSFSWWGAWLNTNPKKNSYSSKSLV